MTETTPETPKMPETARTKRIIFEHQTGPLAGMSQILGTTDDLPNGGSPLPDFETVNRPDRPRIPCSLIRVHRGGAYYREIAPPARMKRFNEA